MKTKFFKKTKQITTAIFRWMGFIACLIVSLCIIVSPIVLIILYCSYTFGSTERIEPERQAISIKKIDCFYLCYGSFHDYKKKKKNNHKIKFNNKTLEFKSGDIYDGNKCITNQVSIEETYGGFRVYYLKLSYPLNFNEKHQPNELYAKDGHFYIDKDNRHIIRNTISLILYIFIWLWLLLVIMAFYTSEIFDKEGEVITDWIYNICETIHKITKKMLEWTPFKKLNMENIHSLFSYFYYLTWIL